MSQHQEIVNARLNSNDTLGFELQPTYSYKQTWSENYIPISKENQQNKLKHWNSYSQVRPIYSNNTNKIPLNLKVEHLRLNLSQPTMLRLIRDQDQMVNTYNVLSGKKYDKNLASESVSDNVNPELDKFTYFTYDTGKYFGENQTYTRGDRQVEFLHLPNHKIGMYRSQINCYLEQGDEWELFQKE